MSTRGQMVENHSDLSDSDKQLILSGTACDFLGVRAEDFGRHKKAGV